MVLGFFLFLTPFIGGFFLLVVPACLSQILPKSQCFGAFFNCGLWWHSRPLVEARMTDIINAGITHEAPILFDAPKSQTRDVHHVSHEPCCPIDSSEFNEVISKPRV